MAKNKRAKRVLNPRTKEREKAAARARQRAYRKLAKEEEGRFEELLEEERVEEGLGLRREQPEEGEGEEEE